MCAWRFVREDGKWEKECRKIFTIGQDNLKQRRKNNEYVLIVYFFNYPELHEIKVVETFF